MYYKISWKKPMQDEVEEVKLKAASKVSAQNILVKYLSFEYKDFPKKELNDWIIDVEEYSPQYEEWR